MKSVIISKGSINMKVRAFSTVTRSSKKTKRAVTSLESIPKELLSDVLARVASDSITDMLNAKMSCKDFCNVSEDPHVYKNVTLESFPIVAWTPITEKQQDFLAKCEEYKNPEILYRQAVVNYFNEQTSESTVLNYLDKASESGHVGSMYAKCIVMLFSYDNEIKKEGVKLLSNMKKNRCSEMKVGRNKLFEILRCIWLRNASVRNCSVFCTTRDDHKRKDNWTCDEDEEGVHCAACIADKEISIISRLVPQL